MPFLTIGGVTVSVAVGSVSLRYVNAAGEEERSPSGSLEGGPLVLKREWAMATSPVPASELDAWAGLIDGKGHALTFNSDLYSSRGRGPSFTGDAALITGAKWGSHCLRVSTGGDPEVRWAIGYDDAAWTVLAWVRDENTPATWRHLIQTPTAAYINGVLSADPLDLALVRCGAELSLGDLTGATGLLYSEFDDVVALPHVIPSTWVASLYAQHSASAWSALPRLAAAGTFSTAAVTVRGKVTDARAIRYTPTGGLTNGYTIQFTLREV